MNPNEKREKDITERAKHSGNHKVQKYVEDGLLPKLEQLGPHGGVFLEGLEHDWDEFAKPEGMLKGFSEKDFAALHKALFGLE